MKINELITRYGPYKTKEGYLFYCFYNSETKKTNSVYEHRQIMAEFLGRELTEEEVVHHINEQPDDNRLENLKLMIDKDHARHHRDAPEVIEIVCAWCKEVAFIFARHFRYNQNTRGSTGPFCGRSCAGKWSRNRQIESGTGPKKSEIVHGTHNAYSYHKCRCDTCKAEHARRAREYYERSKQ